VRCLALTLTLTLNPNPNPKSGPATYPNLTLTAGADPNRSVHRAVGSAAALRAASP